MARCGTASIRWPMVVSALNRKWGLICAAAPAIPLPTPGANFLFSKILFVGRKPSQRIADASQSLSDSRGRAVGTFAGRTQMEGGVASHVWRVEQIVGLLNYGSTFTTGSSRPVTASVAGLGAAEVERHTRDDDVRLEQERALDQQRVLIVQQVLPESARHELGQDDRDVAVRIARAGPARCTRAAAPSATGTATRARPARRPGPIRGHSSRMRLGAPRDRSRRRPRARRSTASARSAAP